MAEHKKVEQNMPAKSKENYKSVQDESNPRDNFYTPRYATELLLPFIQRSVDFIWECASGDGNMSGVLEEQEKYGVVATDLRDKNNSDFFDDKFIPEMFYKMNSAIITNPPFGIKQKFFERSLALGRPFALLIPADYSGWIINAIDFHGCEKIVPTRRIDYITPFVCELVHKKEVLALFKKEEPAWQRTLKIKKYDDLPMWAIQRYDKKVVTYKNWKDIPEELIGKHSSADFHSFWLTWGFGLGRTETFVDLSLEMKKRIF